MPADDAEAAHRDAVLALLDAGWRVVVIDNLSTGFTWLVDPRATLVQGEIEKSGYQGRLAAGMVVPWISG